MKPAEQLSIARLLRSHLRVPSSSVPFVAPFAAFLGFMILEQLLGLPAKYGYPLRCVGALLILLAVFPRACSFRPIYTLSSTAVGIAVFVIWVAPDALWHYRGYWIFANPLTGTAASSLTPELKANPLFLALRVLGSMALVPIVEELFWRGWMMRRLVRPDFHTVPLGTYAASAFWIVAVLFASEHGPYWEVGLLAGLIYNFWMIRTRSLGDCIVAHAVTNGLLAAYVLTSGEWQYWL